MGLPPPSPPSPHDTLRHFQGPNPLLRSDHSFSPRSMTSGRCTTGITASASLGFLVFWDETKPIQRIDLQGSPLLVGFEGQPQGKPQENTPHPVFVEAFPGFISSIQQLTKLLVVSIQAIDTFGGSTKGNGSETPIHGKTHLFPILERGDWVTPKTSHAKLLKWIT